MLFPLIGWFHAISIEVCKIKGDCVVNHDCFFFGRICGWEWFTISVVSTNGCKVNVAMAP